MLFLQVEVVMATSGGNNKNPVLIALLVSVVVGFFYIIAEAMRRIYRRSQESPKVARLVRSGFADGLNEEQIAQAFCDDAEKQFGRPLKPSEIAKIKNLVLKEKTKIENL
jgi:hypothetical protein